MEHTNQRGCVSMDVNRSVEFVLELLGNQMPFNQHLGLTRDVFDAETGCIRFPWRDEYMGNPVVKIMHGGVISTILDLEGAFTVLLQLASNSTLPTLKEKMQKGGTIDLRVDYLLPGKGRHFVASGQILRMGKKVTVVRMELHNDEQHLIAVGTGTYLSE